MQKNIKKTIMSIFLIVIMFLGVFVNYIPVQAATTYSQIMLKGVPYYPQKNSGDCGISAISMIEAHALGYGVEHFDAVYEGVFQANAKKGSKPSFSIGAVLDKYKNIKASSDSTTLKNIYNELKNGNPVLIYRTGNDKEHWSVIVGYNGSTSKLEKSGFIVYNTMRGVSVGNTQKTNLKSWLGSCTWKYAYVRNTGAISAITQDVSSLTLENIYALNNLEKGKTMPSTGLLISNGVIKEVKIWVATKSGTYKFGDKTPTKPNTKYYGLMNRDSAMKFSSLGKGDYIYHVYAKDSTGAVINWQQGFTVSSKPTSFEIKSIGGMTLSKTNVTLDFGQIEVVQITSKIPSGKSVTWKSSNEKVVIVGGNNECAWLTGAGAETATITATCGDQVASIQVTVKGNDNTPLLTITDTGVTKIKETSARINATISPGMIIEEAGFYYGTSKDSLKKVKETINKYTETIWYDLGTDKWTSALKPNTTYYYQLYVKVNGETYKTSVSSFKTAKGETYTLTNSEVTKLTTTSAKIKATLSPGVKIEKAGFYYGKSSSNMTKKTETVNAYAESVYYDLGTGKWCDALSPGTKYYYQIYVVINGTEYKSKLATFTTAKNKLVLDSDKYTSLSASDITETSAKIRAEYPKKVYDDAGFYFGTSSDLASMKKTSEYAYGGTPSTSYVNSYKLGVKYDGYGYKWSEPLEPGTKYYYAFYLVLDGTEYVSKVKNFTTSGSTVIKNVEVTSYPTKRDYVVGEKVDTSGVKLKVTYSNGKTENITKGISVSGDASKIGTRQITLKYEGYSFIYNIDVTQPLKGIKLNTTSAMLDVYDVLTLNVTFNPTDTTDSKEVTWKSSNTKVATVDNGMVLAVGGGSATITATCGSKTATCKITVRVPVTDVTLNRTSALLTVKGETVSLKATIAPSDAANKNVTWVSSDTSVAKVSESGVVTAVGEGITTVSVTTEQGGMTAVCVITVDYPELDTSEPNVPQDSETDGEPNTPQNSESKDEPNMSQNGEVISKPDMPQNSEDIDTPDRPQNSETASEPDEPQSDVDTTTPNEPENTQKDSQVDSSWEEKGDTELAQDSEKEQDSENNFIVEGTEILAEDMQSIIEANTSQSIEITNEDGVVFKFVAGSMTAIDGVESYDFSTELKVSFEGPDDSPIGRENGVLRINYTYSGELPGTAIISIPVGEKWAGVQLYYYQVFEDGTYKYTGESAVVDANGNFTIRQRHCSDYVISTIAPFIGDSDEKITTTILYAVIIVLLLITATGTVFIMTKKKS